MRTIEKTVFTYDELSDAAKEKARNWYRDGALDYDWWDCIYDWAADAADILGIDLRQRRVTLMGGGWMCKPDIYFNGFYGQGSGSAFSANYKYAKGSAKKIPKETELHRIADGLMDVQRRHFYQLRAKVSPRSQGNSIDVDVWHNEDQYRDIGTAEDDIKQLMNDFNDWIFSELEQEYEWLMSDEQVEESIRANGYEFDEDGDRA